MTRFRHAMSAAALAFAALCALPAHAAPEYNLRIEFTDDFDACTGERVSITGVEHIVGQIVVDGQGVTRFVFHRNTAGEGFGAVSGARYRLIDAVRQGSVELASGEPAVISQVYTTRLLRLGETGTGAGDDSSIVFVSRLVLEPDGTLRAVVEIERVECR